MKYARLGDTGLIVSRLALGSMTFGTIKEGPFASTFKVNNQAGASELVARAIDRGVNFFNSADVYAGGESEQMLGKAIGARRKDVVIATKVGNRMGPCADRHRPLAGRTFSPPSKAASRVSAPTTSTSISFTRSTR